MNYVLGFLFDVNTENVLLLRKNRPDWQKGKLNGIGGKVEAGETPKDAMYREAEEEIGALNGWEWVCCVENANEEVDEKWKVDVYVAIDVNLQNFSAKTDEQIEIHPVKNLPSEVIENLHWLIPMAIHDNEYYSIQTL